MLCKMSENQEVVKDLGSESLLRKFILLSKYFNPSEQIDKGSEYSHKIIDGENIF